MSGYSSGPSGRPSVGTLCHLQGHRASPTDIPIDSRGPSHQTSLRSPLCGPEPSPLPGLAGWHLGVRAVRPGSVRPRGVRKVHPKPHHCHLPRPRRCGRCADDLVRRGVRGGRGDARTPRRALLPHISRSRVGMLPEEVVRCRRLWPPARTLRSGRVVSMGRQRPERQHPEWNLVVGWEAVVNLNSGRRDHSPGNALMVATTSAGPGA